MLRCLCVGMILSVFVDSAVCADAHAAPPPSGELRSIFNGNDLSGWDGDSRLWAVNDGVIHGETTPENAAKGNTFLIWKDGTTKDFELRLSFRCNSANNSGIQYRSKHIPPGDKVRNDWVVRGYQHEIRNENKLPNVSGFIYDEGGKRGRIILVGQKGAWKGKALERDAETLIDSAEYEKLFRLDDWNEVVIIAKGKNLQHYMNGRLVMDFTDSDEMALTDGVLALQLHAGKPMWVEFKDIRFADLN